MNYSVVWNPSAESELAEVWINAADRESVTFAANRLDHLLEIDPQEAGESRPEETRIVFDAPLGITIHVNESTQTVFVLEVWSYGRSNRG